MTGRRRNRRTSDHEFGTRGCRPSDPNRPPGTSSPWINANRRNRRTSDHEFGTRNTCRPSDPQRPAGTSSPWINANRFANFAHRCEALRGHARLIGPLVAEAQQIETDGLALARQRYPLNSQILALYRRLLALEALLRGRAVAELQQRHDDPPDPPPNPQLALWDAT